MIRYIRDKQVYDFIIGMRNSIAYNKLCVLLGLAERYEYCVDSYIKDIDVINDNSNLVYHIKLHLLIRYWLDLDDIMKYIGDYKILFKNIQLENRMGYYEEGYYIICDIIDKYEKGEEELVGLSRMNGMYFKSDENEL